MADRLDVSFLDDALAYASQETRYHVADALACHLHNDGYALKGNTADSDAEWFARIILQHWQPGTLPSDWDRIDEGLRETCRSISRAVLAALPAYQLRIAHRLITLSKVVRDIERAERRAYQTHGKTEVAT
jgi:hypothetical protein